MRTLLVWLGGGLALVMFSVMVLGWWFLSADAIDPPDLPGKRFSGQMEWAGLQRSYQLYVPDNLPVEAPLLILLHGSRGSGADMAALSFYSFDVLAEREGLLVAYPDGVERHWNDCRASASYSANLRNIDDVGFLTALKGNLASEYGIDPQRVYVAGMSNGGHMAYRMGLEAPQVVAGIAAYVANLPVAANLDCEAADQPLPVLIVNGTEDPVNPYEGGLVELFGDDSRGAVLSARDSAAYWSALAGYSSDGQHSDWPDQVADDETTVTTLQWQGPGRPAVALVSMVGGGHTMANPVFRLPRFLGPTSHEFDTAELTWQFFRDGEVRRPAETTIE
ncbi:alpha/beta hydrolase family esterase [Parahaliea aestuarii]|uniref:Alpha/beta hydrolase fold domain-containing protein n=1 Tax=Parahaliea aestuarii TaxID=1852021 RepID=A0A5C9A1V0_9GAMM|nr:PHB depolymerase family esterase [Parahaliea aestuarii]TXS94853.1 alpha/beta hydrolase fold domain-containing protein [Parahaliea aestuarii]